MKEYITNNFAIYCEDNIKVLKTFPDNCVDAIVTDPPYGISFMGKKWDYEVPSIELWNECLRVLKPGGHLLAFAGTKTQHRMAVNIEDAGFEIRDMIAWVYGSGFPKSHNIGKTLNKNFGVDFEDHRPTAFESLVQKNQFINADFEKRNWKKQVGASHPEAQKWEGWGTSLKPALEPITMARKPIKRSIAKNALEWGTGGLNIDGCRVSLNGHTGRFPANFIHDGSDEVVALFPNSKSSATKRNRKTLGSFGMPNDKTVEYGDDGSAARFFYVPKCSKKDRNEGLDDFEDQDLQIGDERPSGGSWERRGIKKPAPRKNIHPTVKPTDLMRYLVRMITQEDGIVLDPFMGSGSTGKAAMLEDKKFIGIELDNDYFEIAKARIEFIEKMEKRK